MQNDYFLNLAAILFWTRFQTQFLICALHVAVVTMSRYELFQSQTALLILLMPDTPKTCRSAEPHLNMKQNETQVVRIFIDFFCFLLLECLQVSSLYLCSLISHFKINIYNIKEYKSKWPYSMKCWYVI